MKKIISTIVSITLITSTLGSTLTFADDESTLDTSSYSGINPQLMQSVFTRDAAIAAWNSYNVNVTKSDEEAKISDSEIIQSDETFEKDDTSTIVSDEDSEKDDFKPASSTEDSKKDHIAPTNSRSDDESTHKSSDECEKNKTEPIAATQDSKKNDIATTESTKDSGKSDVTSSVDPSEDSQTKVEKLLNYDKQNVVEEWIFKNDYSNAGTITLRKDGRIIIAFHGTEDVNDGLTDANAFKKKDVNFGTGGYLHAGFYKRYMESRIHILNILQNISGKYNININNADILVTGHSLGGALASICGVDLKNIFSGTGTKIECRTFCSPRVFNHKAAKNIQNKYGEDWIIRYWRDGDAVPAVSLGTKLGFGILTGYKHVGKSRKLESVEGGTFAQHGMRHVLKDVVKESPYSTDHVGKMQKLKNWIGGSWFGRHIFRIS